MVGLPQPVVKQRGKLHFFKSTSFMKPKLIFLFLLQNDLYSMISGDSTKQEQIENNNKQKHLCLDVATGLKRLPQRSGPLGGCPTVEGRAEALQCAIAAG